MSELFKNLPDPNANQSDAQKLAEAAKPAVAPVAQTPTAPTPVAQPAAQSAAPAQVVASTPTPAVTQAPQNNQTNEGPTAEEEETPVQLDELAMLKKRADLMSIKYSNNIGIDALKAKISAKLNNEADTTDDNGTPINQQNNTVNQTVAAAAQANQTIQEEAPERKISLREYMQTTQMKLVRLRITNLDPKKKDLPGEIITVANEYLGTVRKFVPFGEVTDGGYHVPQCIYDVLKERTFVSIKTRKGPRGQTIVENQDAREFSLDILPPLTATELAQLATAQQAKGGLETN